MKRQRWFEIHDSRWFPGFLRDLVTEALEAVWNENRTYRPIARPLREALRQSGADCVVDLCSGGGGPWLGLYDEVAAGQPLQVHLTDRYPSTGLRAHANELRSCGCHRHVTASEQPVDARFVPSNLRGFRTMFSSFHHFDPVEARAMLADAFVQREGIAVFEAARRNAGTMLLLIGVPILALRAAARARPVRLRRIAWTFVVPVVPLVLWIDGLLSCLRSYAVEDLRELTVGLESPDYEWQLGEASGGKVEIRYLIGTPAPAARIRRAKDDLQPESEIGDNLARH
jgi:hypothetical protein